MEETPPGIFMLSDRFVDDLCSLQPTLATESGIEGFDDRWGDFSPRGVEDHADLLATTKSRLAALGPEVDPWDSLARGVLGEFVDQHLESIEAGDPFRDLNNVASSLQTLRDTFDLMPTATLEDWSNIAARLSTIDAAVAGYVERLEEGRRRGMVLPRRQIEAGIQQATASAGEDSTFAGYEAGFDSGGHADGKVRSELLGGVENARHSFGRLARYFEDDYLPTALDEDAVGEDRYLRAARSFLGTNLDAHSAYAWGWEEVGRLRQEMISVGRQIDPTVSLEGVLELLKHDPAHSAPNAEVFLQLMAGLQEQALADLDGTHFEVPPSIRQIEVRLAPPGGALGAYYTPPSEDFSRRGAVWYAFEDPANPVPLYDHISTAYHEGFPGHHLQVGLQVSLADSLSRFHRLLAWSPGYGEGWALYAERLMDELGYLEQPDHRLGMLAAQMLRACRVVIDIGLHLALPIPKDAPFHPGQAWTAGLASEMLTDWAFLDPPYAASEVTRYLGWPAQAISYKLGEKAILDLRAEAQRRAGFDLRRFHARVLGSGPVGLDHLRQLVTSGLDA